MKLLLDTNIALDLLMDRAPFADAAAELFSRIEEGSATGYLCATTVTTLHYLLTRSLGAKQALKEVGKLLQMFEVAPVSRSVLAAALESGFSDFEDAVIYEAARHAGADAIITRNLKDFTKSKLPVYPADEVLHIMATEKSET